MSTNHSHSSTVPSVQAHRQTVSPRRRLLLPAIAALGVSALAWGCAADLEKDPNSFQNAFVGSSATGGATGTGGGSSNGGAAPGTGGGGSTIPPDPSCVADTFNQTGCLGCHGAGTAASIGGGLDLSGQNLGARLSTTKALYQISGDKSQCVAGALIIDPNTPSNSVLLKKVTGAQGSCGSAMPIGSATGLSGSALDCIRNWVMSF